MYCQKCGAIDDGAVRCSRCGSNEYGPDKPVIEEPAPQVVRAQVTRTSKTADDGGAGCAAILIVLAVAFFGWIFGWFGE